jgi:hypothetical protein
MNEALKKGTMNLSKKQKDRIMKICICDLCLATAALALVTGDPVDVALANAVNRAHVALATLRVHDEGYTERWYGMPDKRYNSPAEHDEETN